MRNPKHSTRSLAIELELTLRSDLSEIPKLHDAVERLFASLPADDSARFDVQLALEELVTNVVLYGFPEGSPGRIDLTLTGTPGQVTCRVEDTGIAFDPLSRAAPDTGLDVEDREIGGLGLHFVRETMDSLSYERRAGRNILQLTRRIRDDQG